MSLATGTRLGVYEIVAPLGAGGMGEVYRARDPRLGRDVAIKILPAAFSHDPDRLHRFQREARAVASLNHPHICTLYDIGDHDDGQQFLVMELLEGQSLEDRLAHGPVSVDSLVRWAMEIAEALEAAHAAGIVHRDVKPANIFITRRNEVKVLDFGLATVTPTAAAGDRSGLTTAAPEVRQTSAGTTLGTVAYMSPEQARGEPVGPQSDLFSFGVVLYEMTTGRLPFTGATPAVIFDAILNKAPIAPGEANPALPVDLTRITVKALEKDPALRYQSAAEMRADFRRLTRDLTAPQVYGQSERMGQASGPRAVVTTGDSLASSSDSQVVAALVKRHRIGAATGVVVAALLLAVAVYSLWDRGAPANPSSAIAFEDLEVVQLTTSGIAERPAISPDGKYVVYVQREGTDTSLWVRQTATINPVQIMPAVRGRTILAATVTPDGAHIDVVILETNRSALWRVPFLGGVPRRLIDEVNTPVGWSKDGQRMAFVRGGLAFESSTLIVAHADGSGERMVATRQSPQRFVERTLFGSPAVRPAWSPDDRLLAMLVGRSTAEAGREEIAVFDVASGQEHVLPIPGRIPEGLAWFDNNTLLITQNLDLGSPSQVWRVSYPEGRRTRVTNDVGRYTGMSLSADGNSFVTARPEMRVGIWLGRDDGRNGADIIRPSLFVASSVSLATVSWQGTRLLYADTGSGRLGISRADLGSGAREFLFAGGTATSTSDGATIVFSREGLWRVDGEGRNATRVVDGLWPLITPDDLEVVFLSSASGPQSPWRIPLSGGTPTPITTSFVGFDHRPDVSTDGRVVFGTSDGAPRWVLCEWPQCARRQQREALGLRPRWTPDATGIAYLDRETRSNLWVQPLVGAAPRQLTQFTDGRLIGDYAWSRDGKQLAVSRVSVSSDIVLFRGLQVHRP